MKSRNILFVGNDVSRSGAPMVLLHLIRWLKRNTDWNMTLAVPIDGPLRFSFGDEIPVTLLDAAPGGSNLAKKIHRVQKKLQLDRRGNQKRARAAVNTLPEGRVDLIYCNSVAAIGLLDRFPALNCPVIVHVHELEFVLTHLWWVPDALKKMKKYASHYVACSDAVQANLISRHSVASDWVTVVHEFIDTDVCATSGAEDENVLVEAGIPKDAIVIGAMGSVEWRKGSDLFVPLAKAVLGRRPDLPIYFVWVGGGEPMDRDRLQNDIQVAGLSDRVKLLKATHQPGAWLRSMQVFALLSREDPFPLVGLEAAAAGVPMVCFADAGGMPEFVEQGCGIVVAYLDIEAFASAVIRIACDNSLRESLGQAAREKVIARHDITAAAPLIFQCMSSIMKDV